MCRIEASANLHCRERPTIDAYEATFTEDPLGLWEELMYMMGVRKKKVTEVNI
jgi:hypothetical protein